MKKNRVLYIEIAETIRKKILEGIYPLGTMIPTENELEREYGVSKITIRKAVEVLENEGYVEKRSGVGTRVISDRLFNNLSKAKSFSSIIESEGADLKKEILSIEQVNLESSNQELYAAFGSTAFKVTRIYYLNGEPYIYFQHYLPSYGDKKELKKLQTLSLYKWLAAFGKYPAYFDDRFKIVSLDDQTQNILHTSKDYILQRTRKTMDDKRNTIEISYALYDTEKYPYIIEYEV